MSNTNIETLDFDPFAAGPIERVIGTSEAQREIWLADRIAPQASLAYNESISITLRGALDTAALSAAVDRLVQRHESLRATLAADGMQLFIQQPAPLNLPLHDLTAQSSEARQAALARARAEAVEARFDLENGPLFRAALYRREPAVHELLLTAHHIVCDGWSWGLIVEDLGRLYAEQTGAGPALDAPAAYGDYVRWEQAEALSPEMETHTRFWLERFAGGTVPTVDLPSDRPRPAVRSFASRRTDLMLEGTLVAAVRKIGAAAGASLFATLFGAFAGTLHRLARQDDLVIGVPSAGQAASDMPGVVGHCVNLLPMRMKVEPAMGLQALVRESSRTLLDAFEHQTLTYGTLLKKLQLPRDPSRPTLVSVMFNLDREAGTASSTFPGLDVETIGNARHFENFELFLNCTPAPGGLRLECQYNTGLFEEASVQRWLALYRDALVRFAANPGLSVAEAFAPGEADQRLLAAFNATSAPYERHARIESLIARQAAATPDAIAVVAGAETLRYRELDARANGLALALRNQGVKAGDLVGLSCARNAHMLVALLGILKSGAGYVPLDPSFPRERLDFMVEDAGLRAIVADASTAPTWAGLALQVLEVESVAPVGTAPSAAGSADDVAYVIYTSGSTGRPKGVRVPHRSVVNLVTSLRSVPGMRADHTVLAVTTLSFDIAVSEVIMPLTVGARIVVADKTEASDGERLRALVEQQSVSFIDATPSTWRLLVGAGWPGRRDLLAICTGEPLPPDLARQLLPLVGELWNGYGPTETTVWSSFHRVTQADALVPIGRPVANTRFHVLDDALQPLPVGAIGELYIAGAGVTLGYLNRPELTAERFLPDPEGTDAGARWYKTGDLGRWRTDGILECLGRADQQVKVRGYRIELGEIESNLAAHADVERALVITHEFAPGDVRIVAYVVPRGAMPATTMLRQHLAAFLPEYMVPQHFIALAAVPLLPNGKLDRRALPAPDLRALAGARVRIEPTTGLERQVLALMEQVLSLPGLSMDDDFFAVGGHSLLAARLTAQLGRDFGIRVPLATLFQSPTPAKLAQAIETLRGQAEARPGAPIVHRAGRRSAPLTPMQERIRFIEELHPGRSVYNSPSAHRFTGPLDIAKFEAALREIIRRQPALRTCLGKDAGSRAVVAVIADEVPLELPVTDLAGIPATEREAALVARMQEVADTPMDLYHAPLFRLALFRMAPDDHAFVFVPHHLIWDGWSFDVFQTELSAIYGALVRGEPHGLPPLAATHGDYAEWYAQWLQQPEFESQLRYLKNHIASAPTPAAPTTDMPRRAGMSGQGGTHWINLPQAFSEQLRELSRRLDVTLSMLTLGVYVAMMSSTIRSPSIVVAVPVRGREAPELESVMGFFNNLLPLSFQVDDTQPFRAFMAGVKAELLALMNHQQVPFERLAAEPEFKERAQRTGLYQALFSFQDARERPRDFGNLGHRQMHLTQRGATDDLGIWLLDKTSGIEGAVTYNADIYRSETGAAFRDRFLELLEAVVRNPEAALKDLTAAGSSASAALLQRVAARPASATASATAAVPTAAAPGAATAAKRSAALLMPEQAQLAQVWASVIGIDVNDVRATDNFFDLGGDSLLAMRAIQEAEQALGFRVEARRYVFESLAQLSSSANADTAAPAVQPAPAPPRGFLGRMIATIGRRT